MSKFEAGQEVLFSRGDQKDLKGVVINPHFQLSQSDWPEVLVQCDHLRYFVDIDKVRPAEDPYEYAVQGKDLHGNWYEMSDPFIRLTRDRVFWSDRESREQLLEWIKEEMGPEHRLVKRVKAGKVEVV